MISTLLAKFCCAYSQWNAQTIEHWNQQRSKGLLKFIVFEGFLYWGLFSAGIYALISFSMSAPDINKFITTLLLWLAGSVVYGMALWKGTSISLSRHYSDLS